MMPRQVWLFGIAHPALLQSARRATGLQPAGREALTVPLLPLPIPTQRRVVGSAGLATQCCFARIGVALLRSAQTSAVVRSGSGHSRRQRHRPSRGVLDVSRYERRFVQDSSLASVACCLRGATAIAPPARYAAAAAVGCLSAAWNAALLETQPKSVWITRTLASWLGRGRSLPIGSAVQSSSSRQR